jgi:hypothetical protein
MLVLILLMGHELSLDVLRLGRLSRELLESQQRMRLAASAAWRLPLITDRWLQVTCPLPLVPRHSSIFAP